MSYDLYLVKLGEGVTVEDINDFLESDEFLEYNARDDDEKPVLPDRFVDTDLAEDELRTLAGKAYLSATVPEDERSEELTEYLESEDETEVPEEWEEEFIELFDYEGSNGILPMIFGYGGNLGEAMEMVSRILYELGEGYAIYDPQTNKAVDIGNCGEWLKGSAAEANAKFAEVRKKLDAGEFELCGLDDQDVAALDDEEDEEDLDEEEEEEGKRKKER